MEESPVSIRWLYDTQTQLYRLVRRKEKSKKSSDRHVAVDIWNGQTFDLKTPTTYIRLQRFSSLSLTSMKDLKEPVLTHLQRCVGGLHFVRIKAFAPSKNKVNGWCLFTKDENVSYFSGAEFSWMNPATLRMEPFNKSSYLLERWHEEDKKKSVVIVDQHKDVILEKSNWICYDINTPEDFVRSGAELKNFVDWVRDPPKERVEKVFYGPYWPYIAFYYDCQWVPLKDIQTVIRFIIRTLK
jgi:hypothetical protein